MTVHYFGRDEVEIATTLAATSLDGDKLDALMALVVASPMVRPSGAPARPSSR
jgi:putative Mg2+ transporter-C (MgtC) family protein